jgi:hypothetical protein
MLSVCSHEKLTSATTCTAGCVVIGSRPQGLWLIDFSLQKHSSRAARLKPTRFTPKAHSAATNVNASHAFATMVHGMHSVDWLPCSALQANQCVDAIVVCERATLPLCYISASCWHVLVLVWMRLRCVPPAQTRMTLESHSWRFTQPE